ncbi:DMT family transporter [Fructobacillus pseudoficulneus]|uniref:DMT family transporter n=2 Tax=Fructobacillus pseudoficulneus TaxID=220714 RepID=UPI0008A75F08|nr:DMT family transporter [Fructobacillus pseudoficulneus]SEH42008.1 EamA-like transporter family protein [Fructobacillus pseudoficulneus]
MIKTEKSVKTATVNKGIWLNLSSVVVMSLTPVLNKFSMSTLTPLQASFLNALFSAIITYSVIKLKRQAIPNLFKNKLVILLGITNAISILLQYVSVSLLDPVSVGLFGRFYIIFALLLSIIIMHEKVSKADLMPIIFTLIGTILITNFHGSLNSYFGIISAISYTFFFALTNMLAKKNIENVETNILLFYNQSISSLILGISLLASNQIIFNFKSGVISIFGSAFMSGFLGLYLFYEGLKYISFRNANLIRALNSVFVFLFSIPFFKVPMTLNFILGGAFIIISIIWLGLTSRKDA